MCETNLPVRRVSFTGCLLGWAVLASRTNGTAVRGQIRPPRFSELSDLAGEEAPLGF